MCYSIVLTALSSLVLPPIVFVFVFQKYVFPLMGAMNFQVMSAIAAVNDQLLNRDARLQERIVELQEGQQAFETAMKSRDAQLAFLVAALEQRSRPEGQKQCPARASFSKMGLSNPL
jgi:hypothetical protein